MNQKTKRLCIDAARELGAIQLENALKTATNPEQMNNQIFTLQVCSQYIIAVCAFNLEKQNGRSGNSYIDEFASEIKKELEWLKTQDMELRTHGEA